MRAGRARTRTDSLREFRHSRRGRCVLLGRSGAEVAVRRRPWAVGNGVETECGRVTLLGAVDWKEDA